MACLVVGYAFRRRRQRTSSAHSGWAALGVSIAATALGCASKSAASEGNQAATNLPAPATDAGDCTDRAEGVSLGLSKVSSRGYSFTLAALAPAEPVQSVGPPGNTWTVSITDSSGAPVTGAVLQVSSFMPDHGHYAPTAVGVERGEGSYEIEGLVLPMPGLYAVTLALTLASGAQESVALSLCLTTSS